MSKVTTFFLGWTDLWNWVGILGQAQPARVPRLRVGNSCAWFHSSSRFWQYFVLLPSWFWPVCSADPGAEHKEHTARLSLLGSPRSPEKKGIWHPSGHLGTWDRGHWNAGGRTSVLSRKPCPGKVQTMSDTTVFPICAMSQNPIQITLKQFHQGSFLEMSLQSISSEEKWHVPVQKCAILASSTAWIPPALFDLSLSWSSEWQLQVCPIGEIIMKSITSVSAGPEVFSNSDQCLSGRVIGSGNAVIIYYPKIF